LYKPGRLALFADIPGIEEAGLPVWGNYLGEVTEAAIA
tara:strand:+ start:174 stop:287 length:114 start_codon:yes stop_codon:yes gene_type:complete